MRIMVMTDLEGAAGVVSFARDVYAGAPRLERARMLLTAEVNAAVGRSRRSPAGRRTSSSAGSSRPRWSSRTSAVRGSRS